MDAAADDAGTAGPLAPPPAGILQRLAEAQAIAWYEWLPQDERLLASPGMEALLGQRSGAWSPERLLGLAHPADRDAQREAWTRFVAGAARTAEFTLRSRQPPDGSGRWLRLRVVADRDAAGRVLRLAGTAEDVTAAMEQAAENRALRLRRTASLAVLRAISAAPSDPAPALALVVEQLAALTGATSVQLYAAAGDDPPRLAAAVGTDGGERAASLAARVLATGAPEETGPIALPCMHAGRTHGALLVQPPADGAGSGTTAGDVARDFAGLAGIALASAHTLGTLRERTAALGQAVAHQTAIGEVLRIINASPGELAAVFDAVLERAMRICDADIGFLFLLDGEILRVVAADAPRPFIEYLEREPPRLGDGSRTARAVEERRPLSTDDVRQNARYLDGVGLTRATADLAGIRSFTVVPIEQDGQPLGAFSVGRRTVRPFNAQQVRQVQDFAAQAAIAVQNANLLSALRERTAALEEALAHQTAVGEVLRVINASQGNLAPVFDMVIEKALRVCAADTGLFSLLDGDELRVVSSTVPEPFLDFLRRNPMRIDGSSLLAQAMRLRKPMTRDDIRDSRAYRHGAPHTVAAVDLGGARSVCWVPMLGEGAALGLFAVARRSVRPFTERQVAQVADFAAQAAIAIQNANLLGALRERTQALSASVTRAERALADLRAAQDRLVQTEKLASLGQLTAGIAHEIKNPLNFVNNFADLSGELLDELAAAESPEERAELIGLLRDNLGKIAHHGRRADGIVRNMLLHSRGGAGQAERVAVNALAEDALNLAFHGARAAMPDFAVTLERAYDPAAGEAVLHAQEVTRVLLNLIGNGFHAVRSRMAGAPAGFVPTLRLETRDMGDAVLISVRDNGTGIPPEVMPRLFEPFFTTKPPGEGTGLGLSLSHDIVVKQHGGTLEARSEPGAFAEFAVTLPRRPPG